MGHCQTTSITTEDNPDLANPKRDAIAFLTEDWIETHGLIAHASRNLAGRDCDLTAASPPCIRLSLESLKSFEAVDSQFRAWGITLSNAIALNPSNAAFPPRSGQIVLMGAPKSGWLEVIFHRPARFFNAYVTSSQRAILCAYDERGQVLDQRELRSPNLALSDSSIRPNAQLKVFGPNIARVTLYAFDGQLTLDDPCFGF
jgi:hypothetical protein